MNKFGIIGAMNEEIDSLVAMLENKNEKKVAGLTFYSGTLKNKNVVIVECGISKVNAAMCTQILISVFEVGAVINTGVAGALDKKLNINDIVISEDAIQYDVDASEFGDPVGNIPRMDTSVFVADKRLINAAYESSIKENKGYCVYKGRIATGDIFVAKADKKEYIHNTFDGTCCEMEGGAIAHVCYLNKTPFVVIRAISDKADGKADKTFCEFVKVAAETSKDIVLNMLENL